MLKHLEKENIWNILKTLIIENIDVILVGPQIRHLIPSIKKTTQNKIPVSYINPSDYGMMRVDNVISQIKEMLEG